MEIPVIGMDPSLRNWGLASANLDMVTGMLSDPLLHLVQTKEKKSKMVRQNSLDLKSTTELAKIVIPLARRAKVIFVEVPHGSKSARAMASYGACLGILGAMRAEGMSLIEVSASENKQVFTGNKEATKEDMIQRAKELYPKINWKYTSKDEHLADAVAAIHAGVLTPDFQNLMRLFAKV